MTGAGHPPPPWRLRGEATILPAAIRVPAAHAAGLPPGTRILSAGGVTLGGVLLARYDERATLPYHELIVFSALARAARGLPAFVVSHIYVDSEASRTGGREIWGLPKELADFEWSPHRVAVQHAGRRLLEVTLRHRPGGPGLPLHAPVLGTGPDGALRTAGHGWLRRAAPVLARITVASDSPFASLGVGGTRAGVIGAALDLTFPAPSVRVCADRSRPGTPAPMSTA